MVIKNIFHRRSITKNMNEQLKGILCSRENYNLLYKSIKENTFAKYENYDINIQEYDVVCRDIIKQSIDIAIYQSKDKDTIQSLNKTVLVHSLPKSYRYVTQNASLRKEQEDTQTLPPLPVIQEPLPVVVETNSQPPPTQVLTNSFFSSTLKTITSLHRDFLFDQSHSPARFTFSLSQQCVELQNHDRHYISQPYLENDYEVIGIIVFKKNVDPTDFTLHVTMNGVSVDEFLLEKQRSSFYYYKPILPIILPMSQQYQFRIHHLPQINDYGYITHLRYQAETKRLQITLEEEIYMQQGHVIDVSLIIVADGSELQIHDLQVIQWEEKVLTVEYDENCYRDIDCQATGILVNKTVQTKIIVSKFS